MRADREKIWYDWKIYTGRLDYLPIFGLNLKIHNKRIKLEIFAENGAYVLVGKSGECIFEISIRKYDTRITRMNQIHKTS